MNWMNKWETNQAENEDQRALTNQAEKNEMDHAEKLINDDILAMYIDIKNKDFERALETLTACREHYNTTNPELLTKLSEIEGLLKSISTQSENDKDSDQLNLPL